MGIFNLIKKVYFHVEQHGFRHNRLLFLPAQVKINTGYICNLECPLCPSGRNKIKKAKQLTFEAAQFLISRIGKRHKISLYGWGEPFLNPDIFKIISYLKRNRFYVEMNSNLNIKEDIVNKIESLSFDYLSVSLDGIDKESNLKYRYKGDFDIAFKNMVRLNKSTKGPRKLVWQFIISRKNIDYLEEARALAKKHDLRFYEMNIGLYIDLFYNHSKGLKDEWLTPKQKIMQESTTYYAPKRSCQYLYNDPFIDTDGCVYPCCHAPHAPAIFLEQGFKNIFGNLHDNTLSEIWNNAYYRFIRSKFNDNRFNGDQLKPICLKCKVFLQAKKLTIHSLPSFCEADEIVSYGK
jgi:MoaA/NifB/PqqE/SkfB family radical SAM enzyme